MNSKTIWRIAAAAGVLLGAGSLIYGVPSNQLLGEAGAMSCGGGNVLESRIHDDEAMAQLGEPDEDILARLDDLSRIPAPPSVRGTLSAQTPERLEARRLMEAIEALGPSVLPSVAIHFRDQGCQQPGSAAESALLRKLAFQIEDPMRRGLVAGILLDAGAGGAAALEVTPAGDGPREPQAILAFAEAVRGDNWESLDLPAELEGSKTAILESCARLSLEAASLLVARGVDDPEGMFEAALGNLARLPPQHPKMEAVVAVVAAAAHTAGAAPSRLTPWIANPELTVAARAAACQGALALGATPDQLREVVVREDPPALRRCLVEAGDPEAIRLGLTSPDLELRIASARNQAIAAPDLSDEVSAVFEAAKGKLSYRERAARFDALARVMPVEGLDIESWEPEAALAMTRAFQRARSPFKVPQLAGAPEALREEGSPARADPAIRQEPTAEPPPEGLTADAPGLSLRGGLPKPEPRDLCDVIARPGELTPIIERAIADFGPTVVVCLPAGDYAGPVELEAPGLTLRATEPGARLLGGVILAARAQLTGLDIEGPVVVTSGAKSSRLEENRLSAGGISATRILAVHNNDISEDHPFKVPAGRVVQRRKEIR